MRAADTILKIIYHPEDAPNGVFIECPDLPLGPGELDLPAFFAAWAKAAREREMEPQDNGGLDFDELEVVEPLLSLVAKMLRAQAKLRELDGPTLTVTVGGKLIEMPEGER